MKKLLLITLLLPACNGWFERTFIVPKNPFLTTPVLKSDRRLKPEEIPYPY